MKKISCFFSLLILICVGCEKGDDGDKNTSGEFTLSSKLTFNDDVQSYDFEGFSFAEGKKVSTLSSTANYITVGCSESIVNIQQSGSYHNSFSLYGSYNDAISAEDAFDGLTTVSVTTWNEWANPVEENQIWFFRTKEKFYVKLWVKEITFDGADVNCTIKWVYQPDGTNTFPPK